MKSQKRISEIVGQKAIKEAIAEAEKRWMRAIEGDKYLICDTASCPWKAIKTTKNRAIAAKKLKHQRLLEALYLINHRKLDGSKATLYSIWNKINQCDEDITLASAIVFCLNTSKRAAKIVNKNREM